MLIRNQETLSVLLTGSTHYVATAPDKEAAIYYADANRIFMLAPGGKRLSGTWHLTPSGYHVAWQDGPSAGWQIDAEPGRIIYRDMDAVERGAVSRIVPGDAAMLDAP